MSFTTCTALDLEFLGQNRKERTYIGNDTDYLCSTRSTSLANEDGLMSTHTVFTFDGR